MLGVTRRCGLQEEIFQIWVRAEIYHLLGFGGEVPCIAYVYWR
jgi:hypothetical protein